MRFAHIVDSLVGGIEGDANLVENALAEDN